MLFHLILKQAEKQFNRFLSSEPTLKQKLKSFSGKAFKIELLTLRKNCFLYFSNQKIHLSENYDHPVDVIIR